MTYAEAKSNAEHQRLHKQRRAKNGFRQLNVFVHDADREQVRQFAAKLESRRQHNDKTE